jgi:hypothetical protein
MKALLACWLTAIAVLVWLAIPQASTFEKRSPAALPPSISLQVYDAARKVAERLTFCAYEFQTHWQTGKQCRIG